MNGNCVVPIGIFIDNYKTSSSSTVSPHWSLLSVSARPQSLFADVSSTPPFLSPHSAAFLSSPGTPLFSSRPPLSVFAPRPLVRDGIAAQTQDVHHIELRLCLNRGQVTCGLRFSVTQMTISESRVSHPLRIDIRQSTEINTDFRCSSPLLIHWDNWCHLVVCPSPYLFPLK